MTTLKLPQATVSIDWLSKNINHPNLVILDATIPKVTAKQFAKEDAAIQIKNARFFDIKNKFSDLNSPLPNTVPSAEAFTEEAQKLGIFKDSVIVIYDKLGIYSSPRAWWLFRLMGHQNVAVLDGGFPAWQAAGFAYETATPYLGERGNFEAHFQDDSICYTEDIIRSIDQEQELVLDARSKGRFEATEPEPRAGLRGGHIPNSESLPFNKIVQGGYLVSKEQLIKLFKVSQRKDQHLMFSCGSGITACILALGAEVAGLENTAVYDGSWTEWGLNLELPIDTI